jgi:hypothetical protein
MDLFGTEHASSFANFAFTYEEETFALVDLFFSTKPPSPSPFATILPRLTHKQANQQSTKQANPTNLTVSSDQT